MGGGGCSDALPQDEMIKTASTSTMPNSGVIKFDRFLIATTAAAAPDDDSADVPLELQQEQSAGT